MHFCGTKNSSKYKVKNTSQIFYKYAHINIAVSPEDNSSYLLITRFDLSLMRETGSDILLGNLQSHYKF